MRVLVVAATLVLLAASAEAQMATPRLLLEETSAAPPGLVPGMAFDVRVEVMLTCPHPGYVSLSEWVITGHVESTADVILDGDASRLVPQEYCYQPPSGRGWSDGFRFIVQVPSGFDDFGVHKLSVYLQAANGQEHTPMVVGEVAFEVVEPPQEAANHTMTSREKVASSEAPSFSQEAPGPAMPLLLAGLGAAGVAARRQR